MLWNLDEALRLPVSAGLRDAMQAEIERIVAVCDRPPAELSGSDVDDSPARSRRGPRGERPGARAPAGASRLRRAELRGADLRGADLGGADLSEAMLTGAQLSEHRPAVGGSRRGEPASDRRAARLRT